MTIDDLHRKDPPINPCDFGVPEIYREMAENYANWRVEAEREAFVSAIQAQLDHAAINDHRLTPAFGKIKGDMAVRAANIEAVLDAIRARSNT